MRVLHLYKTYVTDTQGGVAQVIFQLARGLGALGIHTETLSLTTDKAATSIALEGHVAHRSYLNFQRASTGISFSMLADFKRLAQHADIIHYHFPWPFMDVLHFAACIKKPTVVTYHSDIIRQKTLNKLYSPLMHAFLKQANSIVATSAQYLETSEVLSKYIDKTEVIPIGLDMAAYPAASTVCLDYWRARFGNKFFLFVGMLRYYKGLHVLLDALVGLNYPVVILGDGSLMEALKEQVVRLGLKHVHFIGNLPDEDKIALLTLCYAFIFPSNLRSEAFGVSLLEAAMMGKPLISCEIGTGTTYINLHGETGVVIPPNDISALQQAMQFLWNNPIDAERMGNNAKRRYQELFTADKMVAAYAALYQKLVNISSSDNP